MLALNLDEFNAHEQEYLDTCVDSLLHPLI
jgi:hypothetical protein